LVERIGVFANHIAATHLFRLQCANDLSVEWISTMNNRLNPRGLQSLRTHTTRRALPSQKKHELYLKLTTLEMENARRVIERDALVKRLAMLDERLVNIASEQTALLETLDAVAATSPAMPTMHNPSHDSFPIQY